MKTFALPALLVLAVVPGCSREEAPPVSKSARPAGADEHAPAAKPEIVPPGQRRILELEGGVRVEVVAEGTGPIVGPGDEVALSMKLVYVPKPPEPAAVPKDGEPAKEAEDAKGSEGAKGDAPKDKDKDASQSEAPKDEARPKDEVPPVDAPAPAAGDAAAKPVEVAPVEVSPVEGAAEPKPAVEAESTPPVEPTAPAATGPEASAPAATEPPAAGAEAPAPEPDAPAPEPLAAPLEPVVVVDTRNSGTPIRARVGASTTLLPGLSRALVGLRQGTIVEITLPPDAAYGAAGLPSAGIPPGTTLNATIEIREVQR